MRSLSPGVTLISLAALVALWAAAAAISAAKPVTMPLSVPIGACFPKQGGPIRAP